VRKADLLGARSYLFPLLAALGAGCSSSEVKLVDVPRKDIPKEVLDKPIPPEAFKNMPKSARQQMKKMEEAVKTTGTSSKNDQ
jgi:hypothetical protein